MSLFNKFKESRNHALEYKEAVEDNDMDKMTMVLADWLDNGPKDANFGLAMVILTCIRADVPLTESFEIYTSAIQQKPADNSLFDWYNNMAIELMNKRADDEIENNPELSQIFKEEGNVDMSKYGGDDNGYAKEFLKLFKVAMEGDDPLENIQALGKMADIVEEWNNKFPDDANMTCAYVILKIGYLDMGELTELMMRANAQNPIDESSHAELLAIMTQMAMMKQNE